ncbi:histidine kinase [Heyndrickxia shackletonii]|uniref:histidine kinase n=1 Tax=Heyndrickxia shackletonii TaxID=157838 RepID=A0A0Q3WWA2_9BACI|nr:HAMP domain-containing sensor histidine kinase [Heyndrickxia shackletonii]KQL53138.1 histidine kinase [Heyndrickxia shackletonii]NEY98645.1 HAMP domain-containing histidine kinase [Heyndrickxia shackletonii]
MFKKTRINLTILNSIVFILIIYILGSMIYSYIRIYVYRDADHSLQDMVGRVGLTGEIPKLGVQGRDPRNNIIVLIWNEKNELLNKNAIQDNYQDRFIPHTFDKIQTIAVEGFYFHTISVQATMNNQPVKLEFIRNVDIERNILRRLLLMMLIGGAIGIILAIAAGLFLAERALRPIKNAWDKQQQFVSDASHELRTPLTVIQTRGDLLLQTPEATIQDKLPDISIILKECRRLAKLVANLLTLARSDSNELEIERKDFYLDELLRDIVEHFSEVASFQGKAITLTSAPPITFFGDRDRIHQLIVILLDNAMKYTGDNGIIELSCFETKSHIGLTVKDNGIGMKEENLAHIFDRFYQVDKSRTKSESLGLGLSIAQWIIDKHAGKIRVESKLGKGTKFEILFSKRKKI